MIPFFAALWGNRVAKLGIAIGVMSSMSMLLANAIQVILAHLAIPEIAVKVWNFFDMSLDMSIVVSAWVTAVTIRTITFFAQVGLE